MRHDDDLEELAFLLGSPSEAQMWKQHAVLIEAELEMVQTELSKARRDIKRLIDMNQTALDELAALKVAHAALLKEKMGLYVDYVQLQNRLNYGRPNAHAPWRDDVFAQSTSPSPK